MGFQTSLKKVNLGKYFTAGTLVAATSATVASTIASSAVGDDQDTNIREIHHLALDIANLKVAVDGITTALKNNNLIRS